MIDTDTSLIAAMAATIEAASLRSTFRGPGNPWTPGEPLRLLLAGYAGSRNTGADVRVEEMIRQFRHLLGDDHLSLSILTIDPERTRGYFPTVQQIDLPKVFPAFLAEQVHQVHGVVACEGSMFKSKFANALTTLMVGGLGLAIAENKLAIGYGGEAGQMDPPVQALTRRYVRGATLIVRNEQSRRVLADLGLPSVHGTDTAWTYDGDDPALGEQILRDHGWDGQTPVVALCPINPFWWPVTPDVGKTVSHWLTGAHDQTHYTSLYFHKGGSEVDAKQDAYLSAIARATERFRRRHDVFPVLVGMEALDRYACEALAAKLSGDVPVIVSDVHPHWEMVSVLRRCSALVSSRYHAIVCSMPGGVPSAGITMDERIRNLMVDRGTPELALEVDDPGLEDGLVEVLERLWTDAPAIREGIGRCVDDNLVRMGRMGQHLVEAIRQRHPELLLRPDLGLGGDPLDHLPPTHRLEQREVA